jgi:hypothetical protein
MNTKPGNLIRPTWLASLLTLGACAAPCIAAEAGGAEKFNRDIQPLLAKYCYDCHADGENKADVALDAFKTDPGFLTNRVLWWKVLKNVRAGIMPPPRKPQPSADEKAQLAEWIKYGAFGIDPHAPDPGRVTIRRLNRDEYRNTIRDLMGVDYNTTDEFPPDDTGYGFDTIGDVLSISPMLLEKYMKAAETVVQSSVPTVARTVPVTVLAGTDLRKDGGGSADRLSLYDEATVRASYAAPHHGNYNVSIAILVRGDFNFDPGRANLVMKVDGVEQWHQEFKWDDGKKSQFDVPQKWEAGEHRLVFELHPLTSAPPGSERKTSVDLSIQSVQVQGPLDDKSLWPVAKEYRRFFPRDDVPTGDAERRDYARQVLAAFTTRAFRRPADDRTVERLVKIAESVYAKPDRTFEQGIAEAIVAVISSPRFLFRIEKAEPGNAGEAYSRIDEYSLASRLSYFLWSTMPDEELFSLAQRGELRKNFASQVKRLMDDPRSAAMVRNFAGQWLQLRDMDGISIDARVVLARDNGTERELLATIAQFRALQDQAAASSQPPGTPAGTGGVPTTTDTAAANDALKALRKKFPQPAIQLDDNLRSAMRQEPEMLFESIVRDNRGLADLLDCNYTFLNARLAKIYGIPGITGNEMRKVELPQDSPRGGLLTMGSLLVVTSNPTRTSPVKRGLFILDNILGMSVPPPPADVPALEASEKSSSDGHDPTFREVLAVHRSNALCSSCHSHMDPLGLSLENFNALGMYREKERGQSIDASGKLVTGESFHDARDLKQILKKNHTQDFYRCLTEKLLTYALGRGLDYYDVETVDRIVARLQTEDGKFSALLMGVVESVPFQERRNLPATPAPAPSTAPAEQPEQHTQVHP